MTFQPSTAEVDAAEREMVESLPLSRSGNRAPDGYYRPLAEAILTAAHEAAEDEAAEARHAAKAAGAPYRQAVSRVLGVES
jgi:hypothetical protein